MGATLPLLVVGGTVPARIVAPRPGTVRKMFARVTVAPGGVATDTFTLLKNGIATALVVVITGVAVANSNLVAEVAVAAGDALEVAYAGTGADPTATRVEVDFS